MSMIALALPGVDLATGWWATLPLRQQLMYGGVGGVVGFTGANIGVRWVLGVSLIGLTAATVDFFQDPGTLTGREPYEVGVGNTIERRFSRADENTIPVDAVYKKGLDAPAMPTLEREVSLGVAGQTNKGKSSFVKDDVRQWGSDESIFGHGLRGPDDSNEVRDFLADQGFKMLSMSSRGSKVRWDPFSDIREDLPAMQNFATGLYTAEQLKETGWTKSERMLLTAMLVYCSAEHDDFGHFRKVLKTPPEEVIEVVGAIPKAELAVQSLKRKDKTDLNTIYENVNAVMSPLATSDICDPSLPAVELSEFCERSDGRAVVLDNITSDTYASGFWRMLTTSAIDIALEAPGRQQFWLDEIDKLPRIDNLGKLASAGRKSGTRGIIMVQDVHQLIDTYGTEPAKSIWSNCANRVMFSAGDEETAKFFLSGLGEQTLERRKVTTQTNSEGETTRSISYSSYEGKPVLTGEVMNQEAGMAFVQSSKGWWRAKISEPSF